MFRNIQMQEIVISQLPELFAVLLMIVSSYIGTSPPIYTPQQSGKKEKYSFIPNRDAYKINPAKMALETFKLLLLCAKCDKIAEVFLQHATLDTCTSLLPMIDLMPSLADSVFESIPHIVPRLVTSLNQYMQSSFEPQRVVSIAFFVEVSSGVNQIIHHFYSFRGKRKKSIHSETTFHKNVFPGCQTSRKRSTDTSRNCNNDFTKQPDRFLRDGTTIEFTGTQLRFWSRRRTTQ